MNTLILEKIGFTKGEVKAYFALIEIGETTIGPLSKRIKITPSKVYPILDKLIEKGLVVDIIKSGARHFNTSDPKQILAYLEDKKDGIEKQKREIENILPEITAKRRARDDLQTAQVYHEFSGIKTLYNEIIEVLGNNGEDFIGFSLGEEEFSYSDSEHFFREYDLKRKAAGIKTRLISHASQKSYMKSKNYNGLMLRYLEYKMPTGVIIFGNRVATIVWGEVPTAFVIKSEKAAISYRKFFEDMWKIAER